MSIKQSVTNFTPFSFKVTLVVFASALALLLSANSIFALTSGVRLNLSEDGSLFDPDSLQQDSLSNYAQQLLSTPQTSDQIVKLPGQSAIDGSRALLGPPVSPNQGLVAGTQDGEAPPPTSSSNSIQHGALALLIIILISTTAYFIPKKVPPPAKLTPKVFKTSVWAAGFLFALAALYFLLFYPAASTQSLDTRSQALGSNTLTTAPESSTPPPPSLTTQVTGYQSYRLGYNINPPDDWTVDDSRSNLPGDLFIHPSGKAVVMIQDFDDVRGQTPDGKQQLIDEFHQAIQGSNQFIANKIERTTHKGYDALRATGTMQDSTGTWTYQEHTIFFDTGKFLRLLRMVAQGFEDQYQPAVNRVADSITITDPASTRDRLVAQVKTIKEDPVCVNDLGNYQNVSAPEASFESGLGCTIRYQTPQGTKITDLENWYVQNASQNGWQLLESSLRKYSDGTGEQLYQFSMVKCSDSAFDQEAIIAIGVDQNVRLNIVTLPRANSACNVHQQPTRQAVLEQNLQEEGFEPDTGLSQTYSGRFSLKYPDGWSPEDFSETLPQYMVDTGKTITKTATGTVVNSPDGNASVRILSDPTQAIDLPKEGVEQMFAATPVNVKTVSVTSYAGQRAVSMRYSEGGFEKYGLFFVKNGNFYNLTAHSTPDTWDSNKPILLEILRSVQI